MPIGLLTAHGGWGGWLLELVLSSSCVPMSDMLSTPSVFTLHSSFLHSETLQGAQTWEAALEDLVRLTLSQSPLASPQSRPVLKWPCCPSHRFLDTSKQAIGMLFIHFANVYLSDLTGEDPCSLWVHPVFKRKTNHRASRPRPLAALFDYAHVSVPPRYLINFLLDASLGMLLIYAGVRAVSAIVEWRQWDSLRFGEYGERHVLDWPLAHSEKCLRCLTEGSSCSAPHAAVLHCHFWHWHGCFLYQNSLYNFEGKEIR